MNARELFRAIMHFRAPDRTPLWNVEGVLEGAVRKWCVEEGFPLGWQGSEPFDFDGNLFTFNLGDQPPLPAFVPETLAADDTTVTTRDVFGFTVQRHKSTAVAPLHYVYLDGPVKTRRDWDAMARRYEPLDARRFPNYWGEELFERQNRSENPVVVGMNWGPGRGIKNGYMLGFGRFMDVLVEEPQLLEAIFEFWADFMVRFLGSFIGRMPLDGFIFKDDGMGYKTSTLVSPAMFERLYAPHMRKVIGFLRGRGVDVIGYYSSGNLRPLLPALLDIGINLTAPVECAAGMDAVALAEEYPGLLLIGNISREAVMNGRDAIDAEVMRKIPQLMRRGGYIPALDDAVMPDMRFEHVKYCCDLVRSAR
jgi:uroporphyrinogen decarboxylase